MKYAIIIPDGCADETLESLGGKTPLQSASIPHMDSIAREGQVGLSNNTPAHFPAGSEVANMCLMGYDPNKYFTGRAPLEAAAQGISLGPHDWAVRCNLVTIVDQIMVDFTADHVSTAEATALLQTVQEQLGSDTIEFVPGVSYRNLMIVRGSTDSPAPFSTETRTVAPHDLTDLTVANHFPRGPGSDLLSELMTQSIELCVNHPVNAARQAAGKRPVTNLWLWGQGSAPQLPSFQQTYGPQGAMITAVDLLRGLAAIVGWPRIEVEGATGYLDTDYAAKGRAAIKAIGEYDLVCVHIEAPDEASHEGRHDAKIEALQQIDQHIVGPLLAAMRQFPEYRILVMPDHPTFCSTKKHTHGMVPFAIAGNDWPSDDQTTFDEIAAAASQKRFEQGWDLMHDFTQPC